MNRERKLSLVKPGEGQAAAPPPADAERDALAGLDLPDDEPPVTDEELREAEALRLSMERGDDPVASALRAAFAPAPIDGGDLDAILARAMGDADAPPTALEEREAERLRVALDEHDAVRSSSGLRIASGVLRPEPHGQGRLVAGPGARRAEDDAAATAVALRAAWAPSAISAAKNDTLVSRATSGSLSHALSAGGASSSAKAAHPAPAARKAANDGNDAPAPISLRRFRLGPRTFATMSAVVAMAAGVLLLVGRLGQQSEAPAPASVAQAPAAQSAAPAQARIASRSTTDLFDATTPFPRTGGESARVDRIASARASDLRANRFAAWGVR